MRTFNIAGPCKADLHYLIPPTRRLGRVRDRIDGQAYFVVHAPRQTGKTTSFLALAAELTAEGRYASALLSLEVGASAPDDPGAAEDAILNTWRRAAERQLPEELWPPPWPVVSERTRLAAALAEWSKACPRPLVLFLDEIDALRDQTLIAVLRQLRDGFPGRPAHFPWAMALIGMRDVRDYLVQAGSHLRTSSPFNIKEESLLLPGFTRDEVAELYAQHTAATGQLFEAAAVERAWELTQGQPWLANAVARTAIDDVVPDRTRAIGAADVEDAAERRILKRDTHVDSLAERLREPRVAPIVRAVLLGDEAEEIDYGSDDFRYVQDLGLVRYGAEGVAIANPLYREILARELSYRRQQALPDPWWPWQRHDGGLDFPALVDAFFEWWRENADMLMSKDTSPYREAVAHLCAMGFLQRVVNGGGRIHREYAAARGRLDLCVEYRGERFAVEIKRVPPRFRTLEKVEADGIVQLSKYLDTLGMREGWLFVFDQREGRTWDERSWRKEVVREGRVLHLRGG